MSQIVHLTHNDLDALGCILCLEYATLGIVKKTFYTNYQDIEEQVSNVYDYVLQHKPKLLLISDVSFSQYKQLIYKIQELQNVTRVIFIDHHSYPDHFFDDLTLEYTWGEKSATKLVQEKFKLGDLENLSKITNLINTFDIWVEKDTSFPLSLAVNLYFWNRVSLGTNIVSIEELAKEIITNNCKLPPDFFSFYQQYKIDSTEFMKKARAKKLIVSDGFMTCAFVDEYFNEILYEEFSKGVQFIVIANSYGITRFRFSTFSKLSDETKEKIKYELIGDINIGHLNAFSAKIQNSTFDKLIKRIEEVSQIVKKYKI